MVDLNQPRAAASSPIEAHRPESTDFNEFFRTSFRELVRVAMYAGATRPEAEDAAAKTLTEMMPWVSAGERSLAYARIAVVHNFIKDKTRGTQRVAQRLIERGRIPSEEGAEDVQLTVWEDEEWVAHVLHNLPKAQREVMECIVKGLAREEIAEVLGKTRDAVRRNLCDARVRLARELHADREHKQPPCKTARSPREEDR